MGQPRRQRERPRGVCHRGGCAAQGPAPPRYAPARRHQRQHRHRLRHARLRGGLPGHPLHALKRQPGAQTDPRRLRCRDRLHPSRRRLRRCHPHGPQARRRASGPLLLRRPVRQRKQLARPLLRHRQRNLAADRRPRHPFHRRLGYQRHLHGHHAPPARVEPRHPLLFHAARLALQRPGRPEAHGHGDRPAHLRRSPRRAQHRDAHRARLPYGQATGDHAGPAPGRLRCRCCRRLTRRRHRRGPRRPRSRNRHDPLRLRR